MSAKFGDGMNVKVIGTPKDVLQNYTMSVQIIKAKRILPNCQVSVQLYKAEMEQDHFQVKSLCKGIHVLT